MLKIDSINTSSKDMVHYLVVPFEEKDKVKAIGGRWDFTKKKWYYIGDTDSRFEKWEPKQAINVSDLSDEQQEMITLAKEGKNVLVDACIGSGKTTTIQVLCNEMIDKNILYLTYNRLLKVDAQSKITGNNVTATNYHGYAFMCLRSAGIHSGVHELIQTFLANADELQISGYDLLVLDEYQDIDDEISKMLVCIKNSNPNIQIIAVGDMKQKIYDKTTLNAADFIDQFLDRYESVSFTKCFRLCSSLATRLGNIWEKQIDGVNENCELMTMTSYDVVDYLAGQNTADILCLGKRTGKIASVLNELEERYPDKFNKKTVYASISDDDAGGATAPTSSTAIFTTFDGSKGLERKICVVFDYTKNYWDTRKEQPDTDYEILRNIFCVAMSRGKEKIIIVADIDDQTLEDDIIATPFTTNKNYRKPFSVSSMFDFKYDEDIEKCYKLIHKKKLNRTDKSIISVNEKDCMIDLSPCVGIYQEASFFENYNIDEQIWYTKGLNYDRPPLCLKENATMEEKVLYLTAYETYQDRYYCQVKPPFVTEEQLNAIHKRLRTEFTGTENVQTGFEMMLVDRAGTEYKINGRPDVIKDNVIYELKFVNELEHKHFLQLACYMVAFHIDDGILWNVKTNEQYAITIRDEKRFMQAVAKAITKGSAKNVHVKNQKIL